MNVQRHTFARKHPLAPSPFTVSPARKKGCSSSTLTCIQSCIIAQ